MADKDRLTYESSRLTAVDDEAWIRNKAVHLASRGSMRPWACRGMDFPLLAILSIVVGLIGGYAITLVTGIIIPDTYITGIKMDFRLFSIVYALIKMIVYAFVITSISGFYGYYAKGNSLEVGRASTKAVVVSSVVILMMDLIITQISYL